MSPAELRALVDGLDADLDAARNADEARAAASKLLGKKGALTALQKKLGALPAAERPAFGATLNQAKADAAERLDRRLAALEKQAFERSLAGPAIDPTLPPRGLPWGHAHPIMSTMHDIVDIFCRMGFQVAEGPEVEDDFHNFEALNFPPDHPARDMQDTLFVDLPGNLVMRTHTSPVQIRTMLAQPPPVRVVIPGAVYRHDDDATHSPRFFQVEGLLVDDISLTGTAMGTTIGAMNHLVPSCDDLADGGERAFRFNLPAAASQLDVKLTDRFSGARISVRRDACASAAAEVACATFEDSVTVMPAPAGRYYVRAPHPDSLDSRYRLTGWVSEEQIIGRAYALF